MPFAVLCVGGSKLYLKVTVAIVPCFLVSPTIKDGKQILNQTSICSIHLLNSIIVELVILAVIKFGILVNYGAVLSYDLRFFTVLG